MIDISKCYDKFVVYFINKIVVVVKKIVKIKCGQVVEIVILQDKI